jgi:AcrR family transcriptional regulator
LRLPRHVDHDERRAVIAEAAWRLIAERGVDAVTLREIAATIGMANGALKHYFPDKSSIVRTAFTSVFESTNTRVRDRLGTATGLAGLRIFCLEVMPVAPVTRLEARVVLPFWQRALGDPELAVAYVAAMAYWRAQIRDFLAAARAEGSVTSAVTDDVLTEQVLAMINGVQALAVLDPAATTPESQRRMLDAFLDGLQ